MDRNKTYREAEEYIFSIPKFTSKNLPAQTRAFYEHLGKPGAGDRIIHVAGTNGKGSVCAYLNAILGEAGYAVGMFTSPHLISMRERFQIAGIPITEEEFLCSYHTVMQEVEKWNQEGIQYHPTFFETLFFIGMVWFESKKLDYIILETGLGGRLDATNVIESPIITVITKIALDHTRYLGDTLEKIAWEKAGILKKGIPVVFWDYKENVTTVIKERAKELNCAVFGVSCQIYNILQVTNKNIDFSLKSKYYRDIRLNISTCALYQVQNVALALKAIEVVDEDRSVTEEHIKRAVANTKWAGRMEEILPAVYVDGAHNEDGIEAFIETVKASGIRNNQLLFAVVSDKDYASMIRTLMSEQLFTRITVTKVEGERAVSLAYLKEIFMKYTEREIYLYEDAKEAYEDCLAHKGHADRLYIVGSLYLVGLVKRRNCND